MVSLFSRERILFLFAFFSELCFVYPIYNILFHKYTDNEMQAASLLIVIQVSKMLFDLPSGIIADRFSRILSVRLSQVFRIISLLCWLFFNNYCGMFLGCIAWGFAMSCLFGNIEGYLYDEVMLISPKNADRVYQKTIGKFYSYQNIAISLSSFIVSRMLNYADYNLIIIMNIISHSLGIFCSYFMPNNVKHSNKDKFSFKNIISTIILKILMEKKILTLFLITLIQDIIFIFFIDYNTSLMYIFSYKPTNISLIITICGFLRIMFNYFLVNIISKLSNKMMLFFYMFFFLFMILTSIAKIDFLITFIISSYLVFYCLSDVFFKTKFQSMIDSDSRVTILSFSNLFVSLGLIFLYYLHGSVSSFSVYYSIILVSSLFLVCFYLILKFKNDEDSKFFILEN